jgi:tetratricopeptide (TPR) repeat protein
MKKIIHILFKLLELFPWIGTPMKVVNFERVIREHEKNGNLEKARELRATALKIIPPSHQGPLLRSEGEDKLYKQKDYQGALIAFENAIAVMQQSASLFGVTRPDRVYAGAAQASLFCGDKEKASTYYFEFVKLVEKFSENKKLENALQWHRDTMKYLESQLMSASKN